MTSFGAKGIDIKVLKNWDLTKEAVIAAAMKGQRKLAANILGESQKLVPVDTGTLQRSGHISTDAKTQTTTISYNTPYARKQHEDTTLNHPKGGEAKYLERPFNEKAGQLTAFVEDEIVDTLIKEKYGTKAAFKKRYPDLDWENYKDVLT